MEKYLVLTGNEYGFDLLNMVDLNFIEDELEANETYDSYLEEYGCAAMFLVKQSGLKVIKSEHNF